MIRTVSGSPTIGTAGTSTPVQTSFDTAIKGHLAARTSQLTGKLGTRLAAAPSLTGLREYVLSDRRFVDGPKKAAFVDIAKNKFYVQITGSGQAGPHTVGPYWYGPFASNIAAAIKPLVKPIIDNPATDRRALPGKPAIAGWSEVVLEDKRMVDGNKIAVWLNFAQNTFYKAITGAGMAGPETVGPYWYGPYMLPKAATSPAA